MNDGSVHRYDQVADRDLSYNSFDYVAPDLFPRAKSSSSNPSAPLTLPDPTRPDAPDASQNIPGNPLVLPTSAVPEVPAETAIDPNSPVRTPLPSASQNPAPDIQRIRGRNRL